MIDLNSQESIKRMLINISARRGGTVSESTRVTYFIYIKRFCEFCDMTPDELIADRLSDHKSDDIFTRRKHEEMLIKFVQYFRNEGYSSCTIATAVGAVRSFYKRNYLPMTQIDFPPGLPVREYKIPSKEELAQVIDLAIMPWHGAFMTLTKDCGISLQDMMALKLGDGSSLYGSIADQIRNGQVPIHLHIVREKTQFKYHTFLGEDSFDLLNNDAIFPAGASSDKRLFPYSGNTIQWAMKFLQKEMGWKQTFSPYSLRKWFRTQLTLSNMNDALIESMLGHSLGQVRAAYLVPPTQRLIEIYQKFYSALRL